VGAVGLGLMSLPHPVRSMDAASGRDSKATEVLFTRLPASRFGRPHRSQLHGVSHGHANRARGMTTLGGAWTTAAERDPPPRSPQEVCRTPDVADDTLHRQADPEPISGPGMVPQVGPSRSPEGPRRAVSATLVWARLGDSPWPPRAATGADRETGKPTRRGCAGTRQRCCALGRIDVRSLHIVVTRT
jgi:hypothetical protein